MNPSAAPASVHERFLGLELLRIIAMAAIVGGHYYFQNGIHGGYTTTFLSSAPNIAVNVFLLIGVWFMADAPFSAMRPLRLHTTLLFYGWLLTILSVAAKMPDLQYVVQSLFPFLGCALWFATAYICLLLSSPFLNCTHKLNDRQSLLISLVLPGIISFIATGPWGGNAGEFAGGLMWFFCIYLAVSHLKHRTRFF